MGLPSFLKGRLEKELRPIIIQVGNEELTKIKGKFLPKIDDLIKEIGFFKIDKNVKKKLLERLEKLKEELVADLVIN